jgi:AraC family transcriptional regulator
MMSYQVATAPAMDPIGGVSERQPESAGTRADVARILDDLNRSLGRDLAAARAAADRLVQLLADEGAIEPLPLRGGLAPWQKRRIERYLHDNLEHCVRVETLADALPLSVSHFCRAFKETFGETPHAHIMRLRLERAQQLMLATEEPLSQIALACGLADQAHLSKLFRRRVGESPSNWRRRRLREPCVKASFPRRPPS